MDESLETFLGVQEAGVARALIEASRDESAKAVAKSIQAHKMVWEGKLENEKQQLVVQASAWATKQLTGIASNAQLVSATPSSLVRRWPRRSSKSNRIR